MSASIADYFQKLGGASSLVNTPKVTATRSAAGTSLTVDNCNWDTTTGKRFVTFQVDTSGSVVENTEIVWKGVVTSTTSIGSLSRLAGASDTGNAIGDYVMLVPTSDWGNQLVTGLLVQHNQDGTHAAVTATSVSAPTVTATTSVTENGATLSAIRSDYQYDFVASGLVWSGDAYASTRNASMTAGVVYINGQRGSISAVTARSFTASKDTYIDVLNTAGVFTLVYTEVTNNAASPALAANSIRVGIIVTGASNIAAASSVNQGQEDRVLPIASSIPYTVTDSLGNLICPRDPSRKTLGYRINTTDISATTVAQITGLSVPVIVPTGRKIKITLHLPAPYNATSLTGSVSLSVWDGAVGGTQLQSAINEAGGNTAVQAHELTASVTVTPTSTSKTYNAGLSASAGTAHTNGTAAGPGFLLIELV